MTILRVKRLFPCLSPSNHLTGYSPSTFHRLVPTLRSRLTKVEDPETDGTRYWRDPTFSLDSVSRVSFERSLRIFSPNYGPISLVPPEELLSGLRFKTYCVVWTLPSFLFFSPPVKSWRPFYPFLTNSWCPSISWPNQKTNPKKNYINNRRTSLLTT